MINQVIDLILISLGQSLILLPYVQFEHFTHTSSTHSCYDIHTLSCFCEHSASIQHLSHCIVDTITQAYSSQSLPVPGNLAAHSSMSLATSWAALKGWH